jgi:galactokinase
MALVDRRDAAPVLRVVPFSFAQAFGHAPTGVWTAPYAVRLAGVPGREGITVPVGAHVVMAAAPRADGILRIGSLDRPLESVEIPVHGTGHHVPGWAAPIVETAHALARLGDPGPGADLLLHADLPDGTGLAPSVPLSSATALAWTALHGPRLTALTLDALLRNTVDPPHDTADGDALRSAALCGGDGHALLVGSAGPVGEQPCDLAAAGLRMMLIVPREQPPARGAAASVAASLRGARDEVRRAGRMAALLRDGRMAEALALVTATQRARVPGYGGSWADTDPVVEAACRAGAFGARAAGGGTAVAAFLPVAAAVRVRTAVAAVFRGQGRPVPRFLTMVGGAAAGPAHA